MYLKHQAKIQLSVPLDLALEKVSIPYVPMHIENSMLPREELRKEITDLFIPTKTVVGDEDPGYFGIVLGLSGTGKTTTNHYARSIHKV